MAHLTIDGTGFAIRALTPRKGRAVEEAAARYRASALSAGARACIANGDAQVAILALGGAGLEGAIARARRSTLATVALAGFGACAVAAYVAMAVILTRAMLAHPEWDTGPIPGGMAGLQILLGVLALAMGGFAVWMAVAGGTIGLGDGIEGLARAGGRTLAIGEGRLYLTQVTGDDDEGTVSVRQIRYDAIGSVVSEGGGLLVCDRAGLPLFVFPGCVRIRGSRTTTEGVAEAVAAIRVRIPEIAERGADRA